jgi:diadenosine tetraphosphate (Ap4A) HIT family hydrolase
MSPECPFCAKISAGDVLLQNESAVAFPDGFPLTSGHSLVVPRRHEADFFALTPTEQQAMLDLTRAVQALVSARDQPDGFNIGVNVGAAAGQTVGHAHLHLIPRYKGDVPDPRGGVRWVIPAKAAYWKTK